MDLLTIFKETIKQHNLFLSKDKLLLAVSGGIDSVVLCELCKQAGLDFSIAHCNFKLRGAESERDEHFTKELAKNYNVLFYTKAFDTKAIAALEKKSIEETARHLRYTWFYELVNQSSNPNFGYILTGHHADDNVETVVMNFFRGTGIKGLRGILPKNDRVVRPLLNIRRKEIETFASIHQLKYMVDSTNLETAFTRNFFRNNILPEVLKFYPAAENNILRNIERFVEVEDLYNQAIAWHKLKLIERNGREIHIPVLKLKKSSPVKSIIFEIIKDFGFSPHQADEVIALLDSESGKYISSPTHRIIRNRNWLIVAPIESEEAATIVINQGEREVHFSLGKLQVELSGNKEMTTGNNTVSVDAKEISFPLILRKWKTGDYFYPLGMEKKKKLSRFFIDNKLSKTEKENAWVIESNRRIVWIVGHRLDNRFKLTDKTKDVLRLHLIFPKETGVL